MVDRFTYQGLRYVQADTPPVIKPYAGQLQDQDEKGSLAVVAAVRELDAEDCLPGPRIDGDLAILMGPWWVVQLAGAGDGTRPSC